MTKAARQAKLLEIVREGGARTQAELTRRLSDYGIDVSQVTLSRDMRELGLVKTADGYQESGEPAAGDEASLARVLRAFAASLTTAANLIVVKTKPGGASVVASALDAAGWDEIVGTVAGDDTIFVATESNRDAVETAERLVEAME